MRNQKLAEELYKQVIRKKLKNKKFYSPISGIVA